MKDPEPKKTIPEDLLTALDDEPPPEWYAIRDSLYPNIGDECVNPHLDGDTHILPVTIL